MCESDRTAPHVGSAHSILRMTALPPMGKIIAAARGIFLDYFLYTPLPTAPSRIAHFPQKAGPPEPLSRNNATRSVKEIDEACADTTLQVPF
jgi:hypothetical protein